VLIGDLRCAGLNPLGADLACQGAGSDLAVTVHQHDQRLLLLGLHDQGLDHLVLIDAQSLRDLSRPIAGVGIAETAEGDISLAQKPHRSGHRCFGFCHLDRHRFSDLARWEQGAISRLSLWHTAGSLLLQSTHHLEAPSDLERATADAWASALHLPHGLPGWLLSGLGRRHGP